MRIKLVVVLGIIFSSLLGFRPSTEGPYVVVGDSRERFNLLFNEVRISSNLPYEKLVLKLLPEFEGLPYGSSGGASCPGDKTLVNFTSFDCVTFVESFWALNYTLQQFQKSLVPAQADAFEVFVNNLDLIRYFGGENCGINERIHYFTQQMLEMERSGLVFNVAIANGDLFSKKINYISTNPEKYGAYGECARLKDAEKTLNSSINYYYPVSKIHLYKPLAKSGDIIAFASKEPGLDVSHTGIISVEDGEVLLTHASSYFDKVVHGQSLDAYLSTKSNCTGIFIFRPVFD